MSTPAADRRAVIDLGSNSFRLVVFTARDGWWKRTDEIYEAVRIGEGLAATGALGDGGMAARRRRSRSSPTSARASGLERDEIDPVATSAIRDADNAASSSPRAERTGLAIRVLSSEEEARYGYLAAVNSTTLADGVMLDLGGGSMQLVHVDGRHAAELDSWPLGAVRMTERFLPGDGPAKAKQLRELRAHVAERARARAVAGGVGRATRRRRRHRAQPRRRRAARRRLPEFGVQGFVPDAATRSTPRRASWPSCRRPSAARCRASSPARADLDPRRRASSCRRVMEDGGFDALEVTEAGLREGVFFERLPRRPPSRRCSTTSAARRVVNLAAQYGMDPDHNPHVAHVAHLALGLFDELAAAGLHAGDRVERELLWASALLHDIGMTIDYDDHHKHSRYLVLNAGLPGYRAARGRADRPGGALPPQGRAVARDRSTRSPQGRRGAAARMAALLRLAEDLERSRDQLVREAHVAVADGEVRLELVSRRRRPRVALGRGARARAVRAARSAAGWRS